MHRSSDFKGSEAKQQEEDERNKQEREKKQLEEEGKRETESSDTRQGTPALCFKRLETLSPSNEKQADWYQTVLSKHVYI